ncbi:hypothetical protein PSD17_65790 [Pseudonocardia sp. D17]|nr:hypothetical protein PSD17_65790 [Pseudonocardia sp. D17]
MDADREVGEGAEHGVLRARQVQPDLRVAVHRSAQCDGPRLQGARTAVEVVETRVGRGHAVILALLGRTATG